MVHMTIIFNHIIDHERDEIVEFSTDHCIKHHCYTNTVFYYYHFYENIIRGVFMFPYQGQPSWKSIVVYSSLSTSNLREAQNLIKSVHKPKTRSHDLHDIHKFILPLLYIIIFVMCEYISKKIK